MSEPRMTITRYHENARLSQIVEAGGFIFLSGQVAQEARGGNVAQQARDILAQIDELLAEAGTDRSRIVTASICLADISTFDEFNAVWEAWVLQGNKPARACVEGRIADPELAIEIIVTAVR